MRISGTSESPILLRFLATVVAWALCAAWLGWQPPPVAATEPPEWNVERLAGHTGTVLSAAVSNHTVVDTDTIVLARGDDYPDALAGAPLAGLLEAPILLSDTDGLPQHIISEVDRLRPDRVILLGGPAALDPVIESDLRDLAINEVVRIGGANRFETAALIAGEIARIGGDVARAYLVRGEHTNPTRAWPDAVAVSALAARQGVPILLAGDARIPDETFGAVDQLGVGEVTIIGGPAAVSHELGAIVDDHGPAVSRVAGDSRYATSLAIAERAIADGAGTEEVWLVSGGRFADALVAAVGAERADGLMLLIDEVHWDSSAARAFLFDRVGDIETVTVAGSPDAVPPSVDRDLVVARTGRPGTPDTAGAVRIGAGQHIQQVIDAHPPGTHFVLGSGVHRNQIVVPREGDHFTGEAGTVMSGAMPYGPEAFSQLPDGRWAAPAPAEDPTGLDPTWELEQGYERHGYPNELWGDHHRLEHVNAVDMVARPGTWFYDYAGDRIVMFDNPRTFESLELSVTPFAFIAPTGQGISGVTIENLTIRRYANPLTRGALDGADSRHWRINQVELLDNHGAGLKIGPGMEVNRSRFIRNGQMGIGGTDVDFSTGFTAPVTIRDNEVAHNGELRLIWQWEAGSIKFGDTHGLTLVNNWVHSHRGPGPWMDVDSVDSLIESNLVEFNMMNGVMYEISRDAVIANNTIRNNGILAVGDLGAGLWISNSQNVLVEGNTIEGNRLPINAQSSPIEDNADQRVVADLLVRGNDIRIDYNAPGLRVTSDDDHLYTEGNNRFESNTYRLRPEYDRNFYWGEFFDIEGWQRELGHDTNGQFLDLLAPARSPEKAFTLTAFGAS